MSALDKLDRLEAVTDLVRAVDLAILDLANSGGAGPDEYSAVRELVRAVEVRLALEIVCDWLEREVCP